ncbi:tripartite tricarboxylate transporter TctB family protein [Humidisolicoccus flavus]|uniref:tripartite tricarboxylate transporter TctB family protein n=1 Tax=Humidisolicoccus flavus TaxID=3111414 RepID=UPI00325460F8
MTTVQTTETTESRRKVRLSVLVSYGILALIGGAFFGLSFQYDFFTSAGRVGPGFLPTVAGAIVAVLGLALMWQEFRHGSVLLGDAGMVEEESKLSRKTVIKLVGVFGLMTAALLSIPVLGLIGAFGVVILVLTIFVERMPWVTSIIVTVAALVVSYVLFVVALRVPVPMGIFEGLLP